MATPFDHVTAIYTNQSLDYFDQLDEKEKKAFSPYMINRIISMTPEYLEVVNEFQKYLGQVGGRETYLFYSQILPKQRMYSKYVKGSKETEVDFWVVELIAHHHQISREDAKYYISIMRKSEDGKTALKNIMAAYGTDPKKIKKVKL